MTGPKHLWSGDWEDEPAAAAPPPAGRRTPEPAAEPASPVSPTPRRARPPARLSPRLRRALPIAVVAVLIVAAGAWGLTALPGSSGSPGSTIAGGSLPAPAPAPAPGTATAAGTATATTTASATPRPITWLGMEIQTLPPGEAVIETVRLGSEGDRAGLESGEVITRINNRQINGTGDIAPAIRGVHSGDQVQLQVSQGSSSYQTAVTLAAPPSAYP